MTVTAVIVNWNSRRHLEACLTTLSEQSPHEIVVIDAGSFDGSQEYVRSRHPAVRFIQHESNCGFARANNIAASGASGEYLLFLNPDTEVQGAALRMLVDALATHARCAIVGPRLLNTDGSLQHTSVLPFPTLANQLFDAELLRTFLSLARLGRSAELEECADGSRVVEAVSGASLMIRRSVFVEIGGFSEDYFMYSEDIDLAYKAAQSGYEVRYVPGATVLHHGGSSSDSGPTAFAAVMLREATWRFLRSTRGRLYGALYRTEMAMSAVARLFVLAPIALFCRSSTRLSSARASIAKWLGILRWSIGRSELIRRYYA